MRASQKAETFALVTSSPLPTRKVLLANPNLAKSTYYR